MFELNRRLTAIRPWGPGGPSNATSQDGTERPPPVTAVGAHLVHTPPTPVEGTSWDDMEITIAPW